MKFFKNFGLLIFSLLLIGLIYLSSEVFYINSQNKDFNSKIANLENEINLLKPNKTQVLNSSNKNKNNDRINSKNTKQNKTTYTTTTTSKTATSSQKPSKIVVEVNSKPVTEKLSIIIENVGAYQIRLDDSTNTAFQALLSAQKLGLFNFQYQNYGDFGAFITCMAGICQHDNYYWMFYLNGKMAQQGISTQKIKANDIISFKLQSF